MKQIHWRPGTAPRKALRIGKRWYVWKSTHPKEERIVELTEDYRDEQGYYIAPELVEWDGVETCPDLGIVEPKSE